MYEDAQDASSTIYKHDQQRCKLIIACLPFFDIHQDEMLKKHFISDNLLLVNCISRLDLADECSEILNQIYGDFVEKGPNQLLLAVIEMYLSYEKYDDAEILIQKKLKQPGTTQSLTALLYKVLVIDCVLRKNGLQSAFKEVERIPDQYHIKQINCKT
eukprot:TRINITY_DN6271_c0_g1_i12.p3 TRINITY_DN6271_c0_g1~~TRINITY_DN6271_c0_g1_i12.p3  ORF type:complete len:158 (-),score=13.35 TRINITY_DN6271_c0_g1_i12:564-1037(-)